MVKKGDTLIEVLLAVGIFSMIAIAVVSVMSSGTSDAQLALETTLARQEIDAQAESLRFIHDSYIANKNANSDNLPIVKLWGAITKNAINPNGTSNVDEILQYHPTVCPTFNGSGEGVSEQTHAFVINPRTINSSDASAAYIPAYSSGSWNSIFQRASTYPRLIFGNNTTSEDSRGLASDPLGNRLVRAEGIYVVAVADGNTTAIVNIDGEYNMSTAAFYDFYIRTCWYGTDAETPSTISTVIRLYDPNITTNAENFNYSWGYNGNQNYSGRRVTKERFESQLPTAAEYPRGYTEGWTFDGWCALPEGSSISGGTRTSDGLGVIDGSCPSSLINPSTFVTDQSGQNFQFIRMFTHTKYTIEYDSNGSSWQWNNGQPQICYEDENEGKCIIQGGDISRSGYVFDGWCSGSVNGATCNGQKYQTGDIIYAPSGFPEDRKIKLTAIWRERNETITIKLTWSASTDYDSYIVGTKSSGEGFTAYYSNKKPTETVSGVTRTLAELDQDCTGSCKSETFTINTLGGRNYYYFVRNYSSNSSITNATVVVSGPYLGTYTFKASDATGSGRVWNVFAYKDGKIISRQTRTSSSDSSGTSGAQINY